MFDVELHSNSQNNGYTMYDNNDNNSTNRNIYRNGDHNDRSSCESSELCNKNNFHNIDPNHVVTF